MSLINDALKQTQKIQPQNPPASPPPLPPVECKKTGGHRWLAPGIIILLLVAAGIFVGLSLSKPTPLAASAKPDTNSLAALAAPKPVVVTNAETNTIPEVVAPPKPPEPKLQGILFAATRPCAIVNGQTVYVGDSISEFRVAAISKDSITLRNGTETRVLSLNPQ